MSRWKGNRKYYSNRVDTSLGMSGNSDSESNIWFSYTYELRRVLRFVSHYATITPESSCLKWSELSINNLKFQSIVNENFVYTLLLQKVVNAKAVPFQTQDWRLVQSIWVFLVLVVSVNFSSYLLPLPQSHYKYFSSFSVSYISNSERARILYIGKDGKNLPSFFVGVFSRTKWTKRGTTDQRHVWRRK